MHRVVLLSAFLGFVSAAFADGEVVFVDATVQRCEKSAIEGPGALSVQFYYVVTFVLTEPSHFRGKSITVFYPPCMVEKRSPLRRVGARFRFDFDTRDFETRLLSPLALGNFKYVAPR